MEKKTDIKHFRDLVAYRKAFAAAMKIYALTKDFSPEEITGSMQEASETQCWLEFALACQYIDQGTFDELDSEYEQIPAILNSMELNGNKFCY